MTGHLPEEGNIRKDERIAPKTEERFIPAHTQITSRSGLRQDNETYLFHGHRDHSSTAKDKSGRIVNRTSLEQDAVDNYAQNVAQGASVPFSNPYILNLLGDHYWTGPLERPERTTYLIEECVSVNPPPPTPPPASGVCETGSSADPNNDSGSSYYTLVWSEAPPPSTPARDPNANAWWKNVISQQGSRWWKHKKYNASMCNFGCQGWGFSSVDQSSVGETYSGSSYGCPSCDDPPASDPIDMCESQENTLWFKDRKEIEYNIKLQDSYFRSFKEKSFRYPGADGGQSSSHTHKYDNNKK